jgi:hypothetical protein
MATKNLEKDKARFAEWRRQKQGREPIPEERSPLGPPASPGLARPLWICAALARNPGGTAHALTEPATVLPTGSFWEPPPAETEPIAFITAHPVPLNSSLFFLFIGALSNGSV